MRSLLNLLFILTAIVNLVHGQSVQITKQVISTGGGSAHNGAITLSYTLGQSTTIGASITESAILQQGFQTGRISIKPSSSPDLNEFEVFIFPNPTTDKIIVKHSKTELQRFRLVLFDLKGRKLEEQIHSTTNEVTTSFKTKVKGVYQLLIECLETKRQITKTLILL